MIINTTRSWEKGTAYELAKAHVADKIAEDEKKTAEGENEIVSGSGLTANEADGRETTEKTQEAKTDVFLSSIKNEKEQDQGLFSALSASQSAEDSGGFQMKSSAPDDSVGQLAAMLARAETKLDVLQVSGKAMRALVNLKASAATAKGDEAKKLAAQIKRMEKLIKRIEKKLKHLDKEEDLERERKRAVEKAEKQKAEQIEDELNIRKKKRRRDEKNYADKELAQDEKDAASETLASLSGLGSASAPSLDAVSGMDAAMGGDIPDVASLDVIV
ncbi:MAG: hypothetical protein HFI67_00860 [Lachnospiraceae bacterium]|jgi:hypothetical protein|nr:hypothetical protein [Lachnospiraceae bacterium]